MTIFGLLLLLFYLFQIILLFQNGSGGTLSWDLVEGMRGFKYVPYTPPAQFEWESAFLGFSTVLILGLVFLIFALPVKLFVMPMALISGVKNQRNEFTFGADGLTFKAPHFYIQVDWSVFGGFYEDTRGSVLLNARNKPLAWIPWDGFGKPEDVSAYRSILRENIKSKKEDRNKRN